MVEHNFGLAFRAADLDIKGLFQEIQAEVVFGTPSKYCAGAGICMVSITGSNSRIITCPRFTVWISSDHPGNLLFRFEKSHMQPEVVSTHFKHDTFLVEEKFRLPLYLKRQMGLSSIWVLPGAYQLREQDKDWSIRFTLG